MECIICSGDAIARSESPQATLATAKSATRTWSSGASEKALWLQRLRRPASPRMCVGPDLEQGTLRAVKVNELNVERKIRLVYPARRALSHAAKAFLEVILQPA